MKKKIVTIENRWDILYKEYPEIYERFAETQYKGKNVINSINRMFKLRNKVILDVGSGTGLSAIALAKYAKFVYGIEPEEAMRRIALKKAKEKGIKNVKFLDGSAEKIPLKAKSVDMVVGITSVPVYHPKISKMEELAEKFVKEATRVVNEGGHIVAVNVAPEWYGGELAPILLGKSRKSEDSTDEKVDMILRNLNFKYKDVFVFSRFNSLKEAVETYGFIFGKKAIDYLISHKKTSIRWKFRINYK